MKIVNFRVYEDEHKLMQAICDSQGHSVSSYIRAHFKTKAVELGITADPLHELRVSVKNETTQSPNAEPSKPRVIPQQAPKATTAPTLEYAPYRWAGLPEPD